MTYPIHLTLKRQHLTERAPARAWRRVVRDLIAVQCQYEAAGALALNARVEGLTHARVVKALYADRSLLKMWAVRGTLHFVLPEDWKLLVAVIGPLYRDMRANTDHGGISFADREAWLYPAILEALADGPLTVKQILVRLQETAGHRHPNLGVFFGPWGGILGGMAMMGYIVLADSAGAATRVARADQWLRPDDAAPYAGTREQAVKTLLKRYLKTYGPATEADFYWWSQCGRAQAQQAWTSLRPQLTQVLVADASKKPLYALRSDVKALQERRVDLPVRLLPKFDAVTLMHREKSRVVEPAHYKKVFRIAAQVEATLLVKGKLAGTWRHRRKGRALLVDLYPFGRLSRAVRRDIETEAERVARFFGLDTVELSANA